MSRSTAGKIKLNSFADIVLFGKLNVAPSGT